LPTRFICFKKHRVSRDIDTTAGQDTTLRAEEEGFCRLARAEDVDIVGCQGVEKSYTVASGKPESGAVRDTKPSCMLS